MADFLNPAFINPTILYLVLLAGLWIAITAAHIGGTGVLEIAAFIVLAGCIYVLTLMQTNWWALLMLVVGAATFMVLPYVSSKFAHLAELGLLLQAVGGYMLFADQSVSPLVIAMTVGVSWLYNRFVLLPILKVHREPTEYDDATHVIGARGRVVHPINPVGTVTVNSEIWTARSVDPLPAETEVIVKSKQGLELVVEKAKRDDPLPKGV